MAVRSAVLEEGSDRYNEAVEFMRDEEAPAEDDPFTEGVGNYERGSTAYTIG